MLVLRQRRHACVRADLEKSRSYNIWVDNLVAKSELINNYAYIANIEGSWLILFISQDFTYPQKGYSYSV